MRKFPEKPRSWRRAARRSRGNFSISQTMTTIEGKLVLGRRKTKGNSSENDVIESRLLRNLQRIKEKRQKHKIKVFRSNSPCRRRLGRIASPKTREQSPTPGHPSSAPGNRHEPMPCTEPTPDNLPCEFGSLCRLAESKFA